MTNGTAMQNMLKRMKLVGFDESYYTDLIEEGLISEQCDIIYAYSEGWHDGQELMMNKIKGIAKEETGGDDKGEDYYNANFKLDIKP